MVAFRNIAAFCPKTGKCAQPGAQFFLCTFPTVLVELEMCTIELPRVTPIGRCPPFFFWLFEPRSSTWRGDRLVGGTTVTAQSVCAQPVCAQFLRTRNCAQIFVHNFQMVKIPRNALSNILLSKV